MERNKRAYDLEYKRTKRKQIVLNISIDEDQRIKDYCAAHNVQVATWIKSLIWSTIDADQPASDQPQNNP